MHSQHKLTENQGGDEEGIIYANLRQRRATNTYKFRYSHCEPSNAGGASDIASSPEFPSQHLQPHLEQHPHLEQLQQQQQQPHSTSISNGLLQQQQQKHSRRMLRDAIKARIETHFSSLSQSAVVCECYVQLMLVNDPHVLDSHANFMAYLSEHNPVIAECLRAPDSYSDSQLQLQSPPSNAHPPSFSASLPVDARVTQLPTSLFDMENQKSYVSFIRVTRNLPSSTEKVASLYQAWKRGRGHTPDRPISYASVVLCDKLTCQITLEYQIGLAMDFRRITEPHPDSRVCVYRMTKMDSFDESAALIFADEVAARQFELHLNDVLTEKASGRVNPRHPPGDLHAFHTQTTPLKLMMKISKIFQKNKKGSAASASALQCIKDSIGHPQEFRHVMHVPTNIKEMRVRDEVEEQQRHRETHLATSTRSLPPGEHPMFSSATLPFRTHTMHFE